MVAAIASLPDDPRPPTVRQRAILLAIAASVAERGIPPTLRELGLAVGVASNNAVHGHLRLLRAKGLIDWSQGLARSLRLTAAGRAAIAE